MARIRMMCDRIGLEKEISIDIDAEVDEYSGIFAEEVQKRVRTLLGNGKVTCEGHFYADRAKSDGYDLYLVDVKMPNGVSILSVWVRHILEDDIIA